MFAERRVDFFIPEGSMKKFVVREDDIPIRTGDTVGTRMVRILRAAVGGDYEIVGDPLPPGITSTSMSDAEAEAFREDYNAVNGALRRQLLAGVALSDLKREDSNPTSVNL